MNAWWLLVCFAIFLIGLSKSGFGSGAGLMIVPITLVGMSHTAYGSAVTLGVMLPLLTAGDVLAVGQHRGHFDGRRLLALLPGTLLGVVVGGTVLRWFHQQQALLIPLIKLEVGLESVILVGLHWWRVRQGDALHVEPTAFKSGITGFLAAVSSTLAHAAGPIIALYLLPQRLDRRVFVATCALYFFLLNLAKMPVYLSSQMLNRQTLTLSGALVPLVIVGAMVGKGVNRRMSDLVFTRIVYGVTFALGWYLIADATTMLARG